MQQVNFIFPCFNPPFNWKETFVFHCKSLIDKLLGFNIHFILVDDGSSSGFLADDMSYVKKFLPNCELISHSQNYGKGKAVRTGVSAAGDGHIIYCDIDFPFGIDPFIDIIKSLDEGSKVVFGKRDQSYHQKLSFLRRFISISYQWINQLIVPRNLSGCQAGMLGISQDAKSIFLSTKINRFLFSTEFARMVYKRGIKYGLVELTLRDIEPHSTINKKSMLQEFSNILFLFTRVPIFKH